MTVLAFLFSTAAAHAAPLFSESFENGSTRWGAVDSNPIVLTSDDPSGSCSTTYQHETVSFSGGRVVSDMFAVSGGPTYCISAWVRASSDATPYLGIDTYDGSGGWKAGYWLIGDPGYNGVGSSGIVPASDGAWHWYASEVTLDPAIASLDLMNELSTAGSGYADFDDITVTAGPCDAAYAGADQHEVCGSDAPMCGADGSCQPTGPLGGGGIGSGGGGGTGGGSGGSTGTGGGSTGGSSTFPGANQTMNPTAPAMTSDTPAAEGTPYTGTNRISAAGGCSIGGTEGERSLGVMLLAFVAVMSIAVRRRRA